MKAIQLHQYGDLNTLKFENVPVPEITDDTVLVNVRAAGVNHIDYLKATGILKDIYPLTFPWIPGRDFSGVIVKVGANVTGFKPGDEVYGDGVDGGAYAEYILIKPDAISLKPESLSFEEAASVPVAAEAAYQGLFHYANITAGQRIFIHGAAGSVGGYLIQLAHQAGATVVATSCVADYRHLKSLGADELIDYNTDFKLYKNKADTVFNLVGAAVQQNSYHLLKEGGLLISTNLPPNIEEAEKHHVKAVMMHQAPNAEDLRLIARLIDVGKLKVHLAKTYELKDAAVALAYIAETFSDKKQNRKEANKRYGKTVLRVT